MSHNSSLNNGKLPASSKREVLFAWGVCLLFAKHPTACDFSSGRLISLGSPRTSLEDFSAIMQKIAEKDLWCSCGKVIFFFSDKDQEEEEQRLLLATKALQTHNQLLFEGGISIAFFVWKLLDYTTITVTKKYTFYKRYRNR